MNSNPLISLGYVNKPLLEKLESGISLVNLKETLNMDPLSIGMEIKKLESIGYLVDKELYINGDVIYKISKNVFTKSFTIKGTKNNTSYRFGVCSDIHIGRELDGVDNLIRTIDYFNKDNINIVFIVGDLFEGISYQETDIFKDGFNQINRFLSNLPYNDNMVYCIVLGNHDISFIKHNGLDVSHLLSLRPDIFFIEDGIVNLGNSKLGFAHEHSSIGDSVIMHCGHSHRHSVQNNFVTTPALLPDSFYPDMISTGFLETTYHLDNSMRIHKYEIKHLVLADKIYEAGREIYPIKTKKKI